MRYRSSDTPLHSPNYGDRPSRLYLFWQRQKTPLRRLMIACTIISTLIWVIWFILSSLSDTSLQGIHSRITKLDPIQVHHIVITGNTLTKSSDIIAQLGTNINQSLFDFSVERARQHINTLPFIDHSRVERHLPDSVIITVFEKIPIAIWQCDRHFILINQNGDKFSEEELSTLNNTALKNLPLVVGSGANKAAPAIITLMSRYPALHEHSLAFIRIGERRWNILMRNGTNILLPEGAEEASFKRLQEYQNTIHILDRPLLSIDMRLPDRMVIHPAETDTAEQNSKNSVAASSDRNTSP